MSAQTPGAPDHELRTGRVESKVVAGSLVTLLAGVAVALLNAVQADSSVLAGLPPWAQFVVLAALPPVLAFAAGYARSSNRL